MKLPSSALVVAFPFLAGCTFVGKDEWAALDKDGDGYMSVEYDEGDDCDDSDPTIHPGAGETCNEKDDDCDGSIDEEAADATSWFTDLDGDSHGDPSASTVACEAPAGTVADNTDCDDNDSAEHPDATWFEDEDGDGYGAGTEMEQCEQPTGWVPDGTDCDDDDSTSYPGAPELCDGLDNDCNGTADDSVDYLDWYQDSDGDGYGNAGVTTSACVQPEGYVDNADDCDDSSGQVHPGAEEVCDGIDNDCDDLTDYDDPGMSGDATWYRDADEDGYGNPADTSSACEQPTGYVGNADDCDDDRAASNPAATEYCNGEDDDCDGTTDENDAADAVTWWPDTDGDGFGASTGSVTTCASPSGNVVDNTDCDDTVYDIHPGADEFCDGIDSDCDGITDEDDALDASTWYADEDSDGYGNLTVPDVACYQPTGSVEDNTDCDDAQATTNPAVAEYCDGHDDDCDGFTDEDDAVDASIWYTDSDGDGYGDSETSTTACYQPTGFVVDNTDCDDENRNANPGSTEICDPMDIDEDCDGLSDEADPSIYGVPLWYPDNDLDGYGDALHTGLAACDGPSGWTQSSTDCDDNNSGVNPGAAERCDMTSIDDDCDGLSDDDDPSVTGTTTWFSDTDGDGFGDGTIAGISACAAPIGTVSDSRDCDDSDDEVFPGAIEIWYDGVDQNCDGASDFDLDGDGADSADFGGDDCDDDNFDIGPDVTEVCDGVDNDCDELIDDDDDDLASDSLSTWWIDSDGDRWGSSTVYLQACEQPSGYVGIDGDCNDADRNVNPSALEVCNGYDDDCDSIADNGSGSYACPCRIEYRPDYEGHPYLFCYGGLKTFSESRAICTTYGYNLAVPNDDSENDWIGETAEGLMNGMWFIGVYLSSSWVTVLGGTASYTNWTTGQPDGQDCVMMGVYTGSGTVGEWWDDNCVAATYFICESTH